MNHTKVCITVWLMLSLMGFLNFFLHEFWIFVITSLIVACLTLEPILLPMFPRRPTAVYPVSFPQPLSKFDIQFLNAVGDLLDLIPALAPQAARQLRDFKLPGMGHCSALIKVRVASMFVCFFKPEALLSAAQYSSVVWMARLLQLICANIAAII